MKWKMMLLSVSLLLSSQRAAGQTPALTPEKMAECAAKAVEVAMQQGGVKLDFTPASLAYVDGMMDDFHTRQFEPAKVRGHVLVMGCYASEVFIRNLDGAWEYPAPDMVEAMGAGPFVKLRGGVIVNPMMKVQKIYEEGLTHSIKKFYVMVAAMVAKK